MKRIAVYGSLLKGLHNHRLIATSKMVSNGTEVVDIPFQMVSLGGFPALVPSDQNNKIKIQVYELSNEVYKAVERLEGYPHFYQKATIQTSVGEAEIYVILDDMYRDRPKVESGDWESFVAEREAAYVKRLLYQ